MERCSHATEAPYEAPIEVGKTQEVLKLFSASRDMPLQNSLNIWVIHPNSAWSGYMPEKLVLSGVELALLRFNEKLVLQQAL